jgi:hypothetical protein
MRTAALSIFLVFVSIGSLQAETIYQWVDKNGVVHFTDQYENVPATERGRAKKETFEDSPKAVVPAPAERSEKGDEGSATNPLGQNEAYWRNRATSWKEKLAEAKEAYEKVNKRYAERTEQLSQRKFGSRTQYKMDIVELDKLNGERKKYEAQINEANDTLKRISMEAEEAGANPDWVK